MEQRLTSDSSGQIAIDGHIISNCFSENDLAAKGYKFSKLNETQINLLMAYDVNTGIPLLSRSMRVGILIKSALRTFYSRSKRWSIETFYNHFKNKANYNSLYQQDYYKMQGLAFIMLVSALIHQAFVAAIKAVIGKSIQDCLLDARMVKENKHRGI